MPSQPQPAAAPAGTPSSQTVNIGIRASLLPQMQSPHVLGALRQQWPDKRFVVHTIGSLGSAEEEDMTPLHDFDDKSLWQHELETMLEEGEIDVVFNRVKGAWWCSLFCSPDQWSCVSWVLTVHAGCYAIDIPLSTSHDRNISPIVAVLPRADAASVLLLSHSTSTPTTATDTDTAETILSKLPANSRIGTTSPLRLAQLRRLQPHLSAQLLHGKPAALLARLHEPDSNLTALVLGGASLARTGLHSRRHSSTGTADSDAHAQRQGQSHTRIHEPAQLQLLHAVGQGLLGALVRRDDAATAALLAPLADAPSTMSCAAERALARSLAAGGCGALVGVSTIFTAGGRELTLRAVATSRDGTQAVEGAEMRQVGTPLEAEALGHDVAADMLERGADALLEKVAVDLGRAEVQGRGPVV